MFDIKDEKTVFTIGNFEMIDEKVLCDLKSAKVFGERLIVGLLSDSCNLKLGSPSKVSDGRRAEALRNSGIVDSVVYVSFDDLVYMDYFLGLLKNNDVDVYMSTEETPLVVSSHSISEENIPRRIELVDGENMQYIQKRTFISELKDLKDELLKKVNVDKYKRGR